MTLPYVARSPFYWSDVTCVARSDGNVDVTYSRPNGNGGTWQVWTGQAEKDTVATFPQVQRFGSSTAFGPSTIVMPGLAPISASNPTVFLRVLVISSGSVSWPGGITGLKLAETPVSQLPTGWFEVLSYGALTYGELNPPLPITSYTARPTSSVALDMRVSLDGGGP